MDYSEFLKDVVQEKVFWFHNGVSVRNIYELSKEIRNINEELFHYHCSPHHDDFANWIGGVIGDIEFAEQLRKIKTKDKYLESFEKRIMFLEKKTMKHRWRKIIVGQINEWLNIQAATIIKISLIILIILFCFTLYIQVTALGKIQTLHQKVYQLEYESGCYNSYFTNELRQTKYSISTNLSPAVCNQSMIIARNLKDNTYEEMQSRVAKEQVRVYEDRVIINMTNTTWATFSDSSSMLPIINHNTKAIEAKVKQPSELQVGDIISYTSGNEIIIHRIVDISSDSEGWYAITKGDNNNVIDPTTVRFSQVQGVIIAIIY